jgi:hypothetical protein
MYIAIENRLFREWLAEINSVIEEAVFDWNSDGVKVEGINLPKTLAIRTYMPVKMFDTYRIERPLRMGLRTKIIAEELALSSPEELLQIEYNDDKKAMVFSIGNLTYEQRIMDIDQVYSKIIKSPFNEETMNNLNGEFNIDVKTIRRAVFAAHRISNEVVVELIEGIPLIRANNKYEKELIVEDKKQKTLIETDLKTLLDKKTEQVSLTEEPLQQPKISCKSTYSIPNLMSILPAIRSEKITVKIANNYPLYINTGLTEYLIAPVVI